MQLQHHNDDIRVVENHTHSPAPLQRNNDDDRIVVNAPN